MVREPLRKKAVRRKVRKVIALFPEAAFGPALNSVGIGQALKKLGHKVVFLSDPGFLDVYKGYGFEAHAVNLSEPMPAEEMAKFWVDFINGHIPNFRKTPYDQIDNYVLGCWEMIVETAKWAEKDLPGVLEKVKPDVICVDNVILFPAVKRYAKANGKPWVRIISCSENEIEDPDIPPHLSGCGEKDKAGFARYRKRFNEVIKPIHDGFNAFLNSVGEKKYPLGQFFEASPHMNILLYPSAVKFRRRHRLPARQFQYLEGCVRKDAPYEVPVFKANNDKPLLYVSYGSLGAGDTELLKRVIGVLGRMPVRALVNTGDYIDQYTDIPPNVIIDKWFPQPSVIPKVDAVIHHGGNNSFTECLYFGKPALIMPYVWDGHDNAIRVQETGHGFRLDRYDWTDEEFMARISAMLTDKTMKAKLKKTSKAMRAEHGPTKAAKVIDASHPQEDRLMPTKLESSAPHLGDPAQYPGPFKDWGPVPTMIEGTSHTSGIVIHKGPDGESEAGIWICTPGFWNCHVTRDEFCYFLFGRCTYTHESGEVIDIVPGTAAFFPQGWRGTCRVDETIRKVYMIR